MKFKFPIIAVLAFTFLITSCTKDPVPTPTPTFPVEGLWVGTFSAPGYPSNFFSFIVYPGGTLLTKGQGIDGKYYYSSGTWSLSSSNVFTGTIVSFVTPNGGSPVTQSITATYLNNGTMTNGTWVDTNNPNGTGLSGTFSTMQRVN